MRDHREYVESLDFAAFYAAAVVIKRKLVPSWITSQQTEVRVDGIDHVGLAVVLIRPSGNQGFSITMNAPSLVL